MVTIDNNNPDINTNSTTPLEENKLANGNPEPEILSAAVVISPAVLPTNKNVSIIVTINRTTPVTTPFTFTILLIPLYDKDLKNMGI